MILHRDHQGKVQLKSFMKIGASIENLCRYKKKTFTSNLEPSTFFKSVKNSSDIFLFTIFIFILEQLFKIKCFQHLSLFTLKSDCEERFKNKKQWNLFYLTIS